jgi:hypothetical protein
MTNNVEGFIITALYDSITCVKNIYKGYGVNLFEASSNPVVTYFQYNYNGVNVGEFISASYSMISILILKNESM